MTKRTMQEEFDIVVEHLATQKERSADSEGQCLYRGPNGLKCAIGALIPDEEYLPEFDLSNSPVDHLLSNYQVGSLDKSRAAFYTSLQKAHDYPLNWGHQGFSGWLKLEAASEVYNLNTKTLDKYLK